jgi:hypothetical protein
MKKLIGIMLLAAVTPLQAQTQALEADLDGNASALEASSLKPGQQR